MSVEFVDTNVFVYAHDGGAGAKHARSVELLARLFEEGSGAVSTQVLAEFYAAATRKLGFASQEAEEVLADLGGWLIHRPTHADLLGAARLQRRHQMSWWDALIVQSAVEVRSGVLWSEDLTHGRRYGPVTVRNPYL